jgi:hypothetical protein
VVAVALFTYIRQQRRLHRRLDDLAAAVEDLTRRATEGPPVVEEQPQESNPATLDFLRGV